MLSLLESLGLVGKSVHVEPAERRVLCYTADAGVNHTYLHTYIYTSPGV